MCGIGGIYRPGSEPIEDEHRVILERIGEALYLRGPDAGRVTVGSNHALVHRRLAIIDLDPRSEQPMSCDDWELSYNGEIYNFAGIRRELEGKHTFRTTSDTEVLLLALQEWGIDGALRRIAGMFAFLAYNKRENVLYAARDHLGIKPLLMTRLDDGSFCFASSAAALLTAQPERTFSPFTPAIASYFALGGVFTRNTVFEGIERVDPATYLRCLPNGQITAHRYWTPQFQRNFTMDDLISIIAEYEVADVPAALFLSGGVDSTFLVAATRNLDCFHLSSPETHYAREAANRFNRRLVEVKPLHADYEKNIKKVIAFHGEPLMSCGIPYTVAAEVAKHGYKMAISANGADELFLGYPRTPIPEHTPDYLPLHEKKTNCWFSEQICHIFRDKRNFDLGKIQTLLPSIHEIGNDAMAKYHLPGFPCSASHRWFELMTYALSDLNPTLDAASMANSIEVRVPFLDHRIVQGVLSWDGARLVTPDLGRKAPLKAYLRQFFAMSFFHRPKLGFSVHEKSLGSIAKIGQHALEKAAQTGLMRFRLDSRFGEYRRDEIYLGNSCHGYEIWKAQFPQVSMGMAP